MTTRSKSMLAAATLTATLGVAAHSAAAEAPTDQRRESCLAHRHDISTHAQTITNATERYKMLQTMPACDAPDDSSTYVPLPEASMPPIPFDQDATRKNPGTATGLSIFGSLVGAAIFGAGLNSNDNSGGLAIAGTAVMLIGPSLGHFYADDGSAAPGITVRSIGSAVLIGGLVSYLSGPPPYICLDSPCDPPPVQPPQSHAGAEATMVIGGAILAVGTIYDIATAGDAARAYNHAHGLDLHVAPMISRTNNGNSTGVALGGSF